MGQFNLEWSWPAGQDASSCGPLFLKSSFVHHAASCSKIITVARVPATVWASHDHGTRPTPKRRFLDLWFGHALGPVMSLLKLKITLEYSVTQHQLCQARV